MQVPVSETPVDSLSALFAAVSRMERDGEAMTHADPVRIVFLRNITVEGIEPFLKYHLYASGIRPEIQFGGYGTLTQDALSDGGVVAKFNPDLIVLALMLEELDPQFGAPGWRPDRVREELAGVFAMLESKTRATIAVNTFLPPLYPELGLVLPQDQSDSSTQVAGLNRFIIEQVRETAPQFCLMDWERYLRLLGAEASLDRRYSYMSKAPFKKAFLNLYAQELSRIVRALKGKAKKCLVLDCDNTLWGGIVGEDGPDGIKLDGNEYPGKAYYDFHTSLLHLAERGVLITLCSKNNEADVLEVLDNHPWCRLKRSHLSGWRINWQDKATNIADLAEELNLGMDSFVFVDDNPVECGMIAQAFPQVTVLQVPEKLYTLPSLVLEDGLFDTLRVSDEDRRRALLYQSESQRKGARTQFGNVESYLFSLGTVASIRRAGTREIPRVAQLTQKTNQFNLTTRRYSDNEIGAFVEGDAHAVFTLSVKDKFGDLGLVGVMILRREGDVGKVDTFLLSCRALGRNLESAMAAYCLDATERTWNVTAWEAEYISTKKNVQTADFWLTSGFAESATHGEHKTYRRSAGTAFPAFPSHIMLLQD